MVAPQILKALPRKNSQHVEPWNYSQSMSICAPDPGSKAVPQVPTHQYLCWIQHHDWSPQPGQLHWRQGDQEVPRRLERQRLQQSSSHYRPLQPWPLRILVIFTDANVSWQSCTEIISLGFSQNQNHHTPPTWHPCTYPQVKVFPHQKHSEKSESSDFRLHQMCIY